MIQEAAQLAGDACCVYASVHELDGVALVVWWGVGEHEVGKDSER